MVCRPGFENDPVEKMRHSAAHVLADAVITLFPTAKPTIGPVIDNGFYYDFDFERAFTEEDLAKIETLMNEIIAKGETFTSQELPKKDAIEFFKKRGDKYKVEIIEGLPDTAPITLYQHGGFTDLCKGPHVEKTSQIKAIKLLSVAGSYWRGDEKREKLQRIYGTAFASGKDLREYLTRLEEAKKRDHRKLGRELELFTFHEEAPASPFFYPKGALVYRLIADYLRGLYARDDYREVITPEILDMSLWEKSGHLEHFKDNMYFTEVEDRGMAVKPMNCPGHCLMFGERKWSYRELPVRLADFGRLHRFERSGVTHGLTRVRTFSQDDAHIYCSPDQMESEIQSFLKLITEVYNRFGFTDFQVAVATKPANALGSPEQWEKAENALKSALEKAQIKYHINPGEGAFYGPKIEFQVKDALARAWQLGTLQVDYSMPERFNLEYIDNEGQAKRPVMLHRAVLGSMERFIGIFLEHCGGAFPLWLAPTQVELIPVGDDQVAYAQEVKKELLNQGFRVTVDARNEKLGLKIRESQLKKIPYMCVIGGREVEAKTLAVRHRKEGDKGAMDLPSLLEKLKAELSSNA